MITIRRDIERAERMITYTSRAASDRALPLLAQTGDQLSAREAWTGSVGLDHQA